MTLSDDSLVLLLLCSHLGLAEAADAAPLTLREWNPLVRQLQRIDLRPADLLGRAVGDIQTLGLPNDEAARLAQLLDRQPGLDAALLRLAGLGIHPLTRADANYPEKYRQRLKESAPAVLFYAGEQALLGQPGIAVVGSRRLDAAGEACARFVGHACGLSGLVLYSGGARGVDSLSMAAALENRGQGVGILADSLEKAVRHPENRAALERGDLCLVTPYSPNAGFSVGTAMGRNRLIYCLAEYAIVVASDAETGGTWAGATEVLKNHWLPVFVLEHAAMPEGNRLLLQKGGLAFPHPFPQHYSQLHGWLQTQSAATPSQPHQLGLFE